ncbi:MAG: phosphoethanolamine transferase [Selenomonadaceae bacterium]|nr:phosphoethanolamine transferase [Selenomonadaceae bacterium]
MFRWGIFLFLLNFLPIAWLNLHTYGMTQPGVLAVDAIFVLTGAMLAAWLLWLVPWRALRRGLFGLVVGISCLLFALELFTIIEYQTLVGAGIVTAILQTNPREAREYLQMYVGWRGMGVILGICMLFVLLRYFWRRGHGWRWRRLWRSWGWRWLPLQVVSWPRDWHTPLRRRTLSRWQGMTCPRWYHWPRWQRWLPVPLLLVFAVSGWSLWTEWHSFVINDSLDIPIVRVARAADTAVTNIRAFDKLAAQAATDVEITRNESDVPYVAFIIGESTSRSRMHLYGYPLANTPNLDALAAKGELAVFRDTIAPATATVAVLRRLLTFADLESDKPWYEHHNFIDVMKAAGYRTWWLSNQESSGIWGNVAQLFASRADEKHFTQLRESHEDNGTLDEQLFSLLDEAMARPAMKNFYVLHLMGGHGLYYMRYPYIFTRFTPADVPPPQDQLDDKEKLEVAQYENAIYYNDFVVSSLIGKFADKEALVIYIPDHGEDLYDNGRHFSGHVEEHPTKATCEVPLLIWASPAYRAHHPEKWQAICAATQRPYMTDDLLHTLLDLLDIRTPEYDPAKSVINPAFDATRRRIVHGIDYDAELK